MQELRGRNLGSIALDTYKECFMARYGTQPVLDSINVANTALNDLVRRIGLTKTCDLIRQFFKMNGDQDWYVRQGHSIPTLSKNIEAINAAMGSKEQALNRSKGLYIRTDTRCPKCMELFQITVRANCDEIGKRVYSTLCEKCK